MTVDPSTIVHGLYIFRWKSGGASLASVGFDNEGRRWFAPTNWIAVPSYDWSRVESVETILLEPDWRENGCPKWCPECGTTGWVPHSDSGCSVPCPSCSKDKG